MFVTVEEVQLLAVVVSDFLCDTRRSYIKLMDGIISNYFDPKVALLEYISYFIPASQDEVEQAFDLFLEIPLEQMPLYVFPKPFKALAKAKSLCPPIEEGPYPWQCILARWRAKIQK